MTIGSSSVVAGLFIAALATACGPDHSGVTARDGSASTPARSGSAPGSPAGPSEGTSPLLPQSACLASERTDVARAFGNPVASEAPGKFKTATVGGTLFSESQCELTLANGDAIYVDVTASGTPQGVQDAYTGLLDTYRHSTSNEETLAGVGNAATFLQGEDRAYVVAAGVRCAVLVGFTGHDKNAGISTVRELLAYFA